MTSTANSPSGLRSYDRFRESGRDHYSSQSTIQYAGTTFRRHQLSAVRFVGHGDNKMMLRLFLLGLLLGMAATASAREAVSCPEGLIPPDKVGELRRLREKYFAACLDCTDSQCEFKEFTAEESMFARQCPVLFCTPVKINRAALLPEDAWEEGTFHFTYRIHTSGRMQDIIVTSIEGEMPEKKVKELLRNTYKPRRFEPVEIGGKRYTIGNLRGSLRYNIRP